MLLKKVFIRFYKSFNDDFLRKNDDRVKSNPWEMIGNSFYPYIEVPIEPKITTVVGANESGKSHLLSAIEQSITGENIQRSDFCRYSHFFTVKRNELKYPDFGAEWCDLSKAELDALRKVAAIPKYIGFEQFLLFRNNVDDLTVYLFYQSEYKPYNIKKELIHELHELLPKPFKIESSIALPASVPIGKLIQLGEGNCADIKQFELKEKAQRNEIIDFFDRFSNANANIEKIFFELQKNNDLKSIFQAEKLSNKQKEFELAYKLLCKVAEVDVDALVDLSKALKEGNEGYANGLIDQINIKLSASLNFPSYWVQDRNFCLKVMARDYDLVFTITDRTGTEYSFDERSGGLKYFLSYYIQYRSHEPHESKSEILLMDEPDAYLSSQAQQDLLKVFNLFANPEQNSHLKRPIQVIYVTHSPFLIDKNHAERIRVLQKGNEDEGTRVVKDFAKNHYEPLRSSIGAYVGETTFIGNCNLMVEGISDQILIAGAATYLRSRGCSNLETLDLNQITIVPSGGASHVPYLVYLARGPAVIVLLDSDNSGNNAKKQLLGQGKGQHRRPLLKEKFILQIGDLKDLPYLTDVSASKNLEIEDIIPLPICVRASHLYLKEFCNTDESEIDLITEKHILEKSKNLMILEAIEIIIKENLKLEEFKISKIGFARNIMKTVHEWSQSKQEITEIQKRAINEFEFNFKSLFTKLNGMQRDAQRKLTKEKLTQKIERLKKSFISDHPTLARREDAVILLDEIEHLLEDDQANESPEEIEEIKNVIQNIRYHYKLDRDLNQTIDDYTGFERGLERIKYAGLLATQEEKFEEDVVSEFALDEQKVDLESPPNPEQEVSKTSKDIVNSKTKRTNN
jgi:predicted ATPase